MGKGSRTARWYIAPIAGCAALLSPGSLGAAATTRSYNEDVRCLSVNNVLVKAKPGDRDHQDSRRLYAAVVNDDAADLKITRAQLARDIAASDQRVSALMYQYMRLPENQAAAKLGKLVMDCQYRMFKKMDG